MDFVIRWRLRVVAPVIAAIVVLRAVVIICCAQALLIGVQCFQKIGYCHLDFICACFKPKLFRKTCKLLVFLVGLILLPCQTNEMHRINYILTDLVSVRGFYPLATKYEGENKLGIIRVLFSFDYGLPKKSQLIRKLWLLGFKGIGSFAQQQGEFHIPLVHTAILQCISQFYYNFQYESPGGSTYWSTHPCNIYVYILPLRTLYNLLTDDYIRNYMRSYIIHTQICLIIFDQI